MTDTRTEQYINVKILEHLSNRKEATSDAVNNLVENCAYHVFACFTSQGLNLIFTFLCFSPGANVTWPNPLATMNVTWTQELASDLRRKIDEAKTLVPSCSVSTPEIYLLLMISSKMITCFEVPSFVSVFC